MAIPHCDTLISGGRVIDPENGVDGHLHVGIAEGKVAYIGDEAPDAERLIDATGKIVAPGFIDLHSHAQNLLGHRLQAFDGVTTTLELESGAAPLSTALEWCHREGRPLHYGFSAGWLHSRIIVMEELTDAEVAALRPLPLESWAQLQDRTAWRQPADAAQIQRIVELTEAQLDGGGLGIGLLLGYCPRSRDEELQAIAELAVRRGTVLFIHGRYGGPRGLTELIDLSRRTGVHVHLCHFGSSNASTVDESSALVTAAQTEGLAFTTESYTYGRASTVIGAAFLAPDVMKAQGTAPTAVTMVETGEVVGSYERLAQLRENDPGALVITTSYDEQDPARKADLQRAVTLPGAAFASDAMPVQATTVGKELFGDVLYFDQWPLPAQGLAVHPRSSGTFVRGISWLHRDAGAIDLTEAIARSTQIPAQILRSVSTRFRQKGHLGVGADADVVVFDLDRLRANTDYTKVRPSEGMDYVLVNGTEVITAGELVTDAAPGQAMLGE